MRNWQMHSQRRGLMKSQSRMMELHSQDNVCQQTEKTRKGNWQTSLAKKETRPSKHLSPKRLRADMELTSPGQEESMDWHLDYFAWWSDNQSRFLLLAKFARKYVSICGTSNASERVFSVAGNIDTLSRESLKTDRVNFCFFVRTTRSQ